MIIIDEMYCKGCGICVRFCPKHILEISREVNRRGYFIPFVTDREACNRCRQCELFCPDFAIFLDDEDEDKEEEGE